MRLRYSNNFRKQLYKQLAILMSVCYLINPLQNQINTVLHELSHGFELPDYVLVHRTDPDLVFEAHIDHTHYDDVIEHNHNLIDFVNAIFDESNESGSSDNSQLTETKWDNHTTADGLKLPINFGIFIIKNYCSPKKNLRKGQFERLRRPPQNYIV